MPSLTFGGWIEGNAVVIREGKVVDILRVVTSEPGRDMAAIVKISNDGTKATISQNWFYGLYEWRAKIFYQVHKKK